MAVTLRRVALGAGGVETTALGFGCANLFRLGDSAGRARLLEAAYDAGIRHFDVAPMYGLGRAEAEVGRFARRRRGDVILATKFGIGPTLLARALGRMQRPVRRTLEALPAVRQQVRERAAGPESGRLGPMLYSAEGYDGAAARASLERSLRALATDYIDLFLLHDPAPGSVRSEEVRCYLEEARRAGWIRSWGVAGEADPAVAVARSFGHAVPVLQLRDDVFIRSLRYSQPAAGAYITFGILGRALTRVVQHVRSDGARRRRWTALVSADCGEPRVVASLLLRAALQENSSGVVLFGTTKLHHIHDALAAAQAAPGEVDPALGSFLAIVEAELSGHQTIQDDS
jgi:D-threo-aldose 1-dehydrogenase